MEDQTEKFTRFILDRLIECAETGECSDMSIEMYSTKGDKSNIKITIEPDIESKNFGLKEDKEVKDFIWEGKVLKTIGDLCGAVEKINTKEVATKFMAEYALVNSSAKENIGYIAAYFDNDRCKQIWDLFDCRHPVFGNKIHTAEEALKKGIEWGKIAKNPHLN